MQRMTMSRPPVGIAVLAAVTVGTLGWVGVGAIALELAAASPSNLAFDLDLLLQAGREVERGGSPYAPELVSGSAPTATHLFYSYPPPVAQAMAAVASCPRRWHWSGGASSRSRGCWLSPNGCGATTLRAAPVLRS